MVPGLAGQGIKRLLQAILELPAVCQTGQCVMGRLPGEIGNVFTLLGHVMQHQHDAADLAFGHDGRAYQGHRYRAAIKPLDQFDVLAATFESTTEDVFNQGLALCFSIFIQQAEQRRQG
ncbi:hypothetical protein D3C77_386950 [compost metagenome]